MLYNSRGFMVRPMSKRKAPSRGPEKPEERSVRADKILRILEKEFPGAATALHHGNVFQLLVATILSAQCTDERVNMVTPGLFRKYPSPASFAGAKQEELEMDIRSTGFFRMKSRNIIACSKALMEEHHGKVPKNIEDLVQLPGVGRKTANVVLGQAYGIASGVVVDTHVHRLSQRLGFTEHDLPEKIEQDLMQIFTKKDWIGVGSLLILHGRKTCSAKRPACDHCPVAALCPSAEFFLRTSERKRAS